MIMTYMESLLVLHEQQTFDMTAAIFVDLMSSDAQFPV
jgi:hypothetical protein